MCIRAAVKLPFYRGRRGSPPLPHTLFLWVPPSSTAHSPAESAGVTPSQAQKVQ